MRIGNRGAHRHRQPHTDGSGQRMDIHQRTVSAEQTAAPQAAGNGNIAHQNAVIGQRLRNRVIQFSVSAALVAQPLLRRLYRLFKLAIPMRIAPHPALYPLRQRV